MDAIGFTLTRIWSSLAGKYPVLLCIMLAAGLFCGVTVGKVAAAEQLAVSLSPARIEAGVPTLVKLTIFDSALVSSEYKDVRLSVGAASDRMLGKMIRGSHSHFEVANFEFGGVVRSFEAGLVPLQQIPGGWQGEVILTLPEDLINITISADEFSTHQLDLWQEHSSAQRFLELEPAGTVDRETIGVLIDGVRHTFDPAPVIIEGRSLVPMRQLFVALGADVVWENDTRTAVGTKGGVEVRIPIGSNFPTINGSPFEIAVPAAIINESTFLPVRFVGNALGDDVSYDSKTHSVIVVRQDSIAEAGLEVEDIREKDEKDTQREPGVEVSLTYHLHVSPGEDGRVEAVVEGEINSPVTFRVLDKYDWIDYAKNIYSIEAKNAKGEPLPVVPVSNGWRVSGVGDGEITDRITFNYSFGVSLQEDEEKNWGSYHVRVTEHDEALFLNGAIFAYPDLNVKEAKVVFHIPESWTVGTTFIPEGKNTFRVEGIPDLRTELLNSGTRMGIVEKKVTKRYGDIEITFLVFRSSNPNYGLPEFWRAEYGNTPEEQMEEYMELTWESIQYFRDIFGFWPGGSRYLITTKVTESDGIHPYTGFTHWMQAWPREQLALLPHHVLHAWVWLWDDAPIKMQGAEWWWIMEGLPTFYEAELTARLTGDDQWLGLKYFHYLIMERAAQFDLLEKLTVHVYALGHMRAQAMDRAIREATGDEKTLEDLMMLLGRRYGIKRQHFDRHQLIEAVNEVAGKDLTDFYNRYFAGIVGRGFAVRELPPVQEYIEEYQEPFFKWMDSFVAMPGNAARGSRTMLFVGMELGLRGGLMTVIDSEGMIAGRSGIYTLDPFRDRLTSLGGPITEQDVIDTLSYLTGVDQSDFFDFYTIGDYRPSIGEIQDWLN